MIADHNNQGFGTLSEVSIGDIATVTVFQEPMDYICIDKFYGYNTGYNLVYKDYTPISEVYQDYLIIYTCAENNEVFISIWKTYI